MFVNGHVFNFAIVAIAGFCVIGAQHVLNNFTANSYETGFRASGVGMELGVGRVGGILGPYVIGLLQQATGGPDAGVLGHRGAAIVAALVIGSLAMQGKSQRRRGAGGVISRIRQGKKTMTSFDTAPATTGLQDKVLLAARLLVDAVVCLQRDWKNPRFRYHRIAPAWR